jgi:hypothetical protein
MDSVTSTQVETVKDIGLTPAKQVKRWLMEIQLADKREKEWRKRSGQLRDKYRQKDAKKNSFNILWSNTDTLLPAVYNSLPKPDVRRRFRDADPLGKAVAEVLCRTLEYSIDTYDFNAVMSNDVLDMLLPGRGISRVRYVPKLEKTEEVAEQAGGQGIEGAPAGGADDDQVLEDTSEELQWEQVVCEHVQWDDYREGPGKVWDEVPWVAFRHQMTRDELVRKFGEEIGKAVKLDASADEEVEKCKDEQLQELFKTAYVWEIWDKDKREVVFVSEGYRDSPLETLPDPLRMDGFFPNPRPLRAVLDSSSNVPIPIPDYYKEQEEELNQITNRISRLIRGLKLRGIYDATLTELSELMRGEDNDLIPAANVTALLERGGLERAIWFLPIDMAAQVLRELYTQRDQIKQIIYEITGISDIMRGATEASETATAQRIKANFGGLRTKRMQAEVQRYVRDILRLKAEIIADRFQPETLMTMTGLQYPMEAQKQQATMQYQLATAQARATGQQPPPPPAVLSQPTWADIIACLRNDAMRTFKVDIETDSTVAASMEDDMAGLQQVIGGVVEVINGFGPAVASGAVPIEVVKEITLAVVRRARLGNAVEDSLEKMQQPAPPQQPAEKQDHSAEVAQIRAESDQKLQAAQAQADAMVEKIRADADLRIEQFRAQSEQQLQLAQQSMEDRFNAWSQQQDAALQLRLAEIKKEQAIEVAEIGANATETAAQMRAAQGDQNAGV